MQSSTVASSDTHQGLAGYSPDQRRLLAFLQGITITVYAQTYGVEHVATLSIGQFVATTLHGDRPVDILDSPLHTVRLPLLNPLQELISDGAVTWHTSDLAKEEVTCPSATLSAVSSVKLSGCLSFASLAQASMSASNKAPLSNFHRFAGHAIGLRGMLDPQHD